MEPRLMKESLEDYTRVMRGRYGRRRGKPARQLLLDEYCQTTGLERKYANKVLRGQRRVGGRGAPRGARSQYEAADIEVLKGVWLAAGQPCGKRLAGEMLRVWLASWQQHHGKLEPAERRRIEGISAAQIDREMAPYRTAGRKRRIASSALAAMQREVAVRCEPWAETAPGALEIDTVALCGGSMEGAIVWALDATDIHSGWTEVRAVWNRGGHATRERLSEIEAALPFRITKLDFDNGTEFLNGHFISHFKAHEPKIELSRSRPYRKNDNAHIEQKNYTHVRLLLGDDRFEHCELVEALNEVLAEWSLWNNLYGAQRRLLSKERQADGKVKRHHEKQASSPSTRLLAGESLSKNERSRLEQLLLERDPIEMKAGIEAKLKAVYARRAQLQAADNDAAEETKMEPQQPPPPGAAAPHKAGRSSVRSVASSSLDSLRCALPCVARGKPSAGSKAELPRGTKRAKKTPATVSSTVRHRAAS
jgi:hypothetical protein